MHAPKQGRVHVWEAGDCSLGIDNRLPATVGTPTDGTNAPKWAPIMIRTVYYIPEPRDTHRSAHSVHITAAWASGVAAEEPRVEAVARHDLIIKLSLSHVRLVTCVRIVYTPSKPIITSGPLHTHQSRPHMSPRKLCTEPL